MKKEDYLNCNFTVEDWNMVVEGGIFSCNFISPYRESKENNGHQITAFINYFVLVYFQIILIFSHLHV